MIKFFLKEDNKLYFFIFFISLIAFHFAYGLHTLNPTNIGWLLNAYHDWGQHYLGPAFYRQEEWHFPLGEMYSFYYPVGTNVGFTDSIPLMALLLKIFTGILPDDFQYYGFWLFSCMFISAVYTKKILKLYNVNNIIILLACVLVVTNPVLIFRGIQASACAHWLFLGSFYYYLKPTTKDNVVSNFKKQGVLMFLSTTINPYLAIMTTGFVVILAIKNYFYDKSLTKKLAILLPLFIIIISFMFWVVFGMIELNNSTDLEVGNIYGTIYSFNLNSFFNSYGFYSKYIPQLGMLNDQQHEGFAYLGLGLITLVILSIFSSIYFIAIKRINKRQLYLLPLFSFCLLLLIFAITNTVSYGTEVLFRYPTLGIVQKFGNVFRAVGRFSWPFYYLMITMAVIIFSKIRMNMYLKIVLFLSITVFQIYDIENLITSRDLKSGGFDSKLDEKKWKSIIDNFDEIITYPAYTNNMVYNMDYQDLMYVALKSKKPISIGYVARENVTEGRAFNDTLLSKLKRGEISKNQVFVTNSKNLKDFNVLIYKEKVNLKRLDKFILIYSKEVEIKNPYKESIENKKYVDSVYNSYNRSGKFEAVNNKWNSVDNVQFYVENYSFSDDVMQISGWAFDKSTNNNSKDSIFIAITNQDKTYLFPTNRINRADVTAAFKKQNVDASGYIATIFTDKLPKANYEVGIVIKSKNGDYHYAKTNELSSIGNKSFKVPAILKEIPPEKPILSNLESVLIENNNVKINGWAAIKDQNSENTKIEIVLLSNDKKYVLESDMLIRHDVTSSFKDTHNYDFSGFTVKFKKKSLPFGTYKIGVIITENKSGKSFFKQFDKTFSVSK